MRDAEAAQRQNGEDTFWGLDAAQRRKYKADAVKLVNQMRHVLATANKEPEQETHRQDAIPLVSPELLAMRRQESEQKARGDTFWGIEQRANQAQITIKVWLRRCRLRRRANMGKTLFDKSMAWQVIESNRIAQERQEARAREQREQREYMRQFMAVPALQEQPHRLSPHRQIVMPLPARLRPASPASISPNLGNSDGIRSSSSDSSIQWWDNAGGMARPRLRSDSLASLADPRRLSGTFESDRARATKIRSHIESIRYKAQQFAILELPKVGKSDAERRRRRRTRKRGGRANGPKWFVEKAERKTLRDKHRERQWEGATRKSYLDDGVESRRKQVQQRRAQREKQKAEVRERRRAKQMRQWEEAKELREARRRYVSPEGGRTGSTTRSPWKQRKQNTKHGEHDRLACTDKHPSPFFAGGEEAHRDGGGGGGIKVVSQSLDWIYPADNDEAADALSPPRPPASPPPVHLINNSMSMYQQDRFRLRGGGRTL